MVIAALALVCSWSADWADSAYTVNFRKQKFWDFIIPPARLCSMSACKNSILSVQLEKRSMESFFVLGIFFGGVLAAWLLSNPDPMVVHPNLQTEMAGYGITDYSGLVPTEIFNWPALLTPRGFIMMVAGGFLVGFGTRYAGGCTSGHAIMGISNLQMPSVIATCCFMVGGFIMANLILPFILSL